MRKLIVVTIKKVLPSKLKYFLKHLYASFFKTNFIRKLKINKKLERKVAFMEVSYIKDSSKHLIHHFKDMDYEIIDCFFDSKAVERALDTAKVIVSEGAIRKKYENQISIEIWHSSGLLKKAVNQIDGIHCNLDYVVSSSEHLNEMYASAFGTSLNKVLPYGSIRTDVFFDDKAVNKIKADFYREFERLYGRAINSKKVYVWIPTFRGERNVKPYLFTGLELHEIDKKLKPDEVLLIKLHPGLKYYHDTISEVTNLLPVNCKSVFDVTDFGLTELIAVSNCLISDYSASILDGIAINKPAVFFAEDIEVYSQERGFSFDYKQEVPNLIERCTEDEFLIAIRTASNTSDKYQKFRNKWVGNCDGKAGERIRTFVDSIL